MGFSFSWIAVQGLTRAQVLEALGAEVSDVQADLLEGLALFDWPKDWVIVFSDEAGAKKLRGIAAETVVLPSVDPFVAPILYAIPVQVLAYHVAVLKGTDVDQPRNLAKSVTVE